MPSPVNQLISADFTRLPRTHGPRRSSSSAGVRVWLWEAGKNGRHTAAKRWPARPQTIAIRRAIISVAILRPLESATLGAVSCLYVRPLASSGLLRRRGLPANPQRDAGPVVLFLGGASNVARHLRRSLPPCVGYLTTPRPRAAGRGAECAGAKRRLKVTGGGSGSNHLAKAMKPRPLTCVAAGCAAGWAWRPRLRVRSEGVSPKTPHALASAGAVHSEGHHGHGTRGVPSGPVELPTGTKTLGAELEERIEKVVYACRFVTFLAIGGLLAGCIPCFLTGCVYVMDAFVEYYLHGGGMLILMLLKAIDMFLIGTVMFVLGTGLYELFISNMDMSYGSNLFGLFNLPGRPKWLVIDSVNDLKTKLGHVIVMVLLVGIFEKSWRVTITSCTDLLCFAASILLSSGCLYLLSRLSNTKGGSQA